MNYDVEFEQLYRELVVEQTDKLETLRLEAKGENKNNNKVPKLVLFILFYTIFIGFMSLFLLDRMPICIVFLVLSIFLVIYECDKRIVKYEKKDLRENYRKEFKDRVVRKIVNHFGSSLEYDYNFGHYSDFYKLFIDADDFETEDLIEGEMNNDYFISIADYILKEYRGDSKKVIFEGLMAETELATKLSWEMQISGSKKLKSKMKKIQVDGAQFDNLFLTYSNNEENVKQVLNQKIKQLLIDSSNIGNFDIVIKEESIYFKLEGKNMFEPPAYEISSLDKDVIYKYYKSLYYIFELSREIIESISVMKN